jgi:hypothetical protein
MISNRSQFLRNLARLAALGGTFSLLLSSVAATQAAAKYSLASCIVAALSERSIPSPFLRIRKVPLGQRSVVLDTNAALVLLGAKSGRLQTSEIILSKKLQAYLAANPSADIRLADQTIAELVADSTRRASEAFNAKGIYESPRDPALKQQLKAILERHGVGAAKGDADREIVTQVFLAARSNGADAPILLTGDRGMVNGLQRVRGVDPGKLPPMQEIPPFEVTIVVGGTPRTIRVVPLMFKPPPRPPTRTVFIKKRPGSPIQEARPKPANTRQQSMAR